METKTDRLKAIEAYKMISEGKIAGIKIKPVKAIRVGSITFII